MSVNDITSIDILSPENVKTIITDSNSAVHLECTYDTNFGLLKSNQTKPLDTYQLQLKPSEGTFEERINECTVQTELLSYYCSILIQRYSLMSLVSNYPRTFFINKKILEETKNNVTHLIRNYDRVISFFIVDKGQVVILDGFVVLKDQKLVLHVTTYIIGSNLVIEDEVLGEYINTLSEQIRKIFGCKIRFATKNKVSCKATCPILSACSVMSLISLNKAFLSASKINSFCNSVAAERAFAIMLLGITPDVQPLDIEQSEGLPSDPVIDVESLCTAFDALVASKAGQKQTQTIGSKVNNTSKKMNGKESSVQLLRF